MSRSISSIPVGPLSNIAGNLNLFDLTSLCLTNRRFASQCQSPSFWRLYARERGIRASNRSEFIGALLNVQDPTLDLDLVTDVVMGIIVDELESSQPAQFFTLPDDNALLIQAHTKGGALLIANIKTKIPVLIDEIARILRTNVYDITPDQIVVGLDDSQSVFQRRLIGRDV